MTVRILVTSAGGALAPLNIRLMKAARRHPMWILAVDQRPEATGRHVADAFAVVPHGSAPDYVDAVVALVAEHAIDLLLPWSDEEALALARARVRLQAAGAILACADLAVLQTMCDKAATYTRLQAAGIRAPAFATATTPCELDAAVAMQQERGDGFVIKPPCSRGNRGVLVVRPDVSGRHAYAGSREWHMDAATFDHEVRSTLAAELPLIVSERLYPPAYDIDVLAMEGQVLRVMPRQRRNPAGVPFTGSVLRPEAELIDLAERITRALALDWLYDYDIMRSREGEAVVLELNPRPSGSIAAAILTGVPFYEDVVSMALGQALPPVELPRDVAVVPYTDCLVVPADDLP